MSHLCCSILGAASCCKMSVEIATRVATLTVSQALSFQVPRLVVTGAVQSPEREGEAGRSGSKGEGGHRDLHCQVQRRGEDLLSTGQWDRRE